MSTRAYTAKAALFDYLDANNGPAQALDGIQVSYAFPGVPDLECIYGGGIRFEQRDAVAETVGVLVAEEALVSVYIRVTLNPPGNVRDSDERAVEIGGILAALIKANPTLGGSHSVVNIARGQGDYTQTDDETISILAYQIRVVSNLSYGSV